MKHWIFKLTNLHGFMKFATPMLPLLNFIILILFLCIMFSGKFTWVKLCSTNKCLYPSINQKIQTCTPGKSCFKVYYTISKQNSSVGSALAWYNKDHLNWCHQIKKVCPTIRKTVTRAESFLILKWPKNTIWILNGRICMEER